MLTVRTYTFKWFIWTITFPFLFSYRQSYSYVCLNTWMLKNSHTCIRFLNFWWPNRFVLRIGVIQIYILEMRQDRKNAEALATHMVHRMQEPTSSSIMRFFQPVSKKIAIEIKPAFKYHVKHSITKLQSTKFVSSSCPILSPFQQM